VLGLVEAEKCLVFLGCDLEEHEVGVELGTADAQVLGCASAPEDGCWFQKCALFSGEIGHEAIADRTCPWPWIM
jgi:hypothetical protein